MDNFISKLTMMKTLAVNLICTFIVVVGGSILINSASGNNLHAQHLNTSMIYMQDCPPEAGPCSCAFIVCDEETDATTEQCWEVFTSCMEQK